MNDIINNIQQYLSIDKWVDHTNCITENCLFFFIKPSVINIEDQHNRINFIVNKLPNITFYLCPVDIKTIEYPSNVIVLDPLNLEEYQYLVKQKYYLKPDKIIGVTGSSGKTSTVNFIHQTYQNHNKKSSYIGTNNCSIDINNYQLEFPISYLAFHEFLHKSKENHCDISVLECSNYTIQQHRIKYIKLDAVIFTSFAEDHQDCHASFLDYFLTKIQLINYLKPQGKIIINNNISYFKSLLPLIKQPVYLINNLLDFHNLNNYNLPQNEDNSFFVFFENNQVTINNQWSIPIDNLYNFLQINNIIMASITYFLLENSVPNNFNYEILPSRFEIFENKNNQTIAIIDYSHSIEKVKYFINMIKKAMNIFFHRKKIAVLIGIGSKENNQRFSRLLWLVNEVDHMILSVDNIIGAFDLEKYTNIMEEFSNVIYIPNREDAIKYLFNKYGNEDYILCCLGFGQGNTLIKNNEIIDYSEIEHIKNLINC